MIYLLLFFEFFKIGLFAIGGGLVTVPFLFDLSQQYNWFTTAQLTDMIAISQSTPGPIGVNMTTYAGYNAAHILGAIVATLALIAPAIIVIYCIEKILCKWQDNLYILKVLSSLRPAVMALILSAGLDIAKVCITDRQALLFALILLFCMRFYKKNAVFYIIISAVAGILLKA